MTPNFIVVVIALLHICCHAVSVQIYCMHITRCYVQWPLKGYENQFVAVILN